MKQINIVAEPGDTVFVIVTLLRKVDDGYEDRGYCRIEKATVDNITIHDKGQSYWLTTPKGEDYGDCIEHTEYNPRVFNTMEEATAYLPIYWSRIKEDSYE